MMTCFSILTRRTRRVIGGGLLGVCALLWAGGAAWAKAPVVPQPATAAVEAAPAEAAAAPAKPEHKAEAVEKEEGLPQGAPLLIDTRIHGEPIQVNSSMLITWIVAIVLIISAQVATRRMKDVPQGGQNFWEWVVESLYNFLQGIIGPSLVRRTFWFFATIFIFILSLNWFSLIPGVGTIGWGVPNEAGALTHITHPLLRGPNADLNMTLAMAMLFFFFWIVWALQVNGVRGFLMHLFGPKGDTKGFMKLLMVVVFFFVGLLEIVSILFRPVSLSFRLFGNIFAGENTLETMTALGGPWFGWLLPIPFYFLELLVGFVQAMVFMLLTAVFTLLIMPEEGHEHH
ncbi:MAG: F0F1 ATP synthase subunit A [Chthoniobacteraceae bacterium]|nr:F0F1 ATP synthase subunit A [Chthoniobacteraceae bacterium]